MSDRTAIEWADATWNPLRLRDSRGKWYCEKLSPGCDHCYSSAFNHRLGGLEFPSVGSDESYLRHGINPVEVDAKVLEAPFHWRKPRRIFVCSMTDLFGEWVTDEQRDRIFAAMALTPHHTYMVLTKRPSRMADYLAHFPDVGDDQDFAYDDIRNRVEAATFKFDLWPDESEQAYQGWPLQNVWAGTTIESSRYTWRANVLRQVPAVVRFISFEPLLDDIGPIDLTGIHWAISGGESAGPERRRLVVRCRCRKEKTTYINGEPFDEEWFCDGAAVSTYNLATGKGSHTPMRAECQDCLACKGWSLIPERADWLRSIRDQCEAAGVKYLHKQNGGPTPKAGGRLLDGRTHDDYPQLTMQESAWAAMAVKLYSRCPDLDEVPA